MKLARTVICIGLLTSTVYAGRISKHTRIIRTPEITFLHTSDTHIIWSDPNSDVDTNCVPSGRSKDGRTDCYNVVELYDPGTWIDPNSGQSSSPTIVLEDFIDYANAAQVDFVVITGDLISNGYRCDDNTYSSYMKFSEIMDGLTVPWYAVNGVAHDGSTMGGVNCFGVYGEFVGEASWNFTIGNNLFIGLKEVVGGENDIGYLQDILDVYSDDFTVFIFTHTAVECYDEWHGRNYRCGNVSLGEAVRTYSDNFRKIIVMSGHNHANIYDGIDADLGVHHFTTTALMNFPTQVRKVSIRDNGIYFSMSSSISSEVDNLSYDIIQGIGQKDPRTMYGNVDDRYQSILID